MLKLGNLNINNAYLGSTGVQKMYLGADLVWGGESYDIIDDIKNYTGSKDWVWATNVQKWYRRNEQNGYEEYGVYGTSIQPYKKEVYDTYTANFSSGSYYVTDYKVNKSGIRIRVQFTTPDAWPSGTSMLVGVRKDDTATYMTNIGYTNTGVIRFDAGSTTKQTGTYTLSLNTSYIISYWVLGSNVKFVLYSDSGTILYDSGPISYSGTFYSGYNLGINTMMVGNTNYSGFTRNAIIKGVQIFNVTTFDSGSMTNKYVFLEDGTLLNTITGYRTGISGGTATYTPTGSKETIISGETTYKGKLSKVGNIVYEWNGSAWLEADKEVYDVCTAIFDGKSWFQPDATVGIMRKYTYIFKPNSNETTTMFISGYHTSSTTSRQTLYMENYQGSGLQYVFGNGTTNPIIGNEYMHNNTWTKMVTELVYSTTKYKKFSASYYISDSFNGTYNLVTSLSNTTGNTVETSTLPILIGNAKNINAPFIGEMHSVDIQYDTSITSGAKWKPYHSLVFVDVNGEIMMYDTVTKVLSSNLGTGTITKGTPYSTVAIYKQYEPKPAPEI